MKKEISYRIRCEEIEVLVTPKRVMRMNLRVRGSDGGVLMSVPHGVTREVAEGFLRDKLAWVRAARARAEATPKPTAPRRLAPENIYLFGESIRVQYREGMRGMRREGGLLVVGVPSGAGAETRDNCLKRACGQILEEALAEELPRHAARIGVSPAGWRVRPMTTRWGSCSGRTKRLTFNLRLLDHPRECLTYVMIHELCHLRVMGHSPAFWSLVERHCPSYRSAARLLNRREG